MLIIKKYISLKVFALVTCALLISACGDKDSSHIIRIGHGLDTKHPVHKAMEYLNERLKFHSQGEMEVRIYPSGQLGTERELLELLQIGAVGMTKVSASSIESFVPEMKVFSLPYIFRDKSHLWNVLNSPLGEELLEAGVPYRIRGVGYYDAGSRSFYSVKKPITGVSDLEGMKIRVMNSPMAIKMVDTMGGNATPISWGELYSALQQGVVDGAENNMPSYYTSKHYEVAKYLILDEHTSIPDVLVISTHVWNKLNPQEQEWMKLAMKESTAFQRELWRTASAEALEAVKKAGVQVLKADKNEFQASVESIIAQHSQGKLGKLIERIRAVESSPEGEG